MAQEVSGNVISILTAPGLPPYARRSTTGSNCASLTPSASARPSSEGLSAASRLSRFRARRSGCTNVIGNVTTAAGHCSVVPSCAALSAAPCIASARSGVRFAVRSKKRCDQRESRRGLRLEAACGQVQALPAPLPPGQQISRGAIIAGVHQCAHDEIGSRTDEQRDPPPPAPVGIATRRRHGHL